MSFLPLTIWTQIRIVDDTYCIRDIVLSYRFSLGSGFVQRWYTIVLNPVQSEQLPPPGVKAPPSYRPRSRVVAGSLSVGLHWSRREYIS
jgi:hypothetical protein